MNAYKIKVILNNNSQELFFSDLIISKSIELYSIKESIIDSFCIKNNILSYHFHFCDENWELKSSVSYSRYKLLDKGNNIGKYMDIYQNCTLSCILANNSELSFHIKLINIIELDICGIFTINNYNYVLLNDIYNSKLISNNPNQNIINNIYSEYNL